MLKKTYAKYLILAFLLLLFYFGQLRLSKSLQIDTSKNLIDTAYIINAFLVIVFFLFIDFFKDKYKDQIGFAFMASSLLKFTLFFIFIYPQYNQDKVISKEEMLTFFIPYTVCLIYESIITSKILNNLKFN